MIRRSIAALILLTASFAPLSAAGADGADDPKDAIGNIRASQAPYVRPADHQGRLIASDFSIRGKVSCPAESIEVVEIREGGNPVAHKAPGSYHAEDVTICGDKQTVKPLLDWFRGVKSGGLTNFRRDLMLEILRTNAEGKETVTCQFNLFRTWPHQINWSPDGTVCVQLAVELTDLVDQ
jgi:tail tube protein gp19